jgi:hypothetical protein
MGNRMRTGGAVRLRQAEAEQPRGGGRSTSSRRRKLRNKRCGGVQVRLELRREVVRW